MSDIVQVAIPRPVWQEYDYLVPEGALPPVVGGRVRIPFGHSVATGIVLGLKRQSKHGAKLKPIDRTIDAVPVLPADLLHLAAWISDYYHFPIGSVFETMLPREALRGRNIDVEPEKQWCPVREAASPEFKNAHRQAQLWKLLEKRSPILESNFRELGVDRKVLEALDRKGLVRWDYVEGNYDYRRSNFALTDEQRIAVDSIVPNLDDFGVHVLDGVTGSGKTEVYIQVIRHVLNRGKQVLVLVPEISLTPQTAETFRSRFGNVAVLHSMKTNIQRFNVWSRIGSGEHRLVIGTRSAVFAPFHNLGLVVVDEEHDTSYKQAESLRYSARDLAVVRANLLRIPCILGSATLSMETLHNVSRGRYSVSKLSHRPGTAQMPTFNVLDIRGHQLNGGMSPILVSKIRQHLAADAQVLILINRRGYARSVNCSDCGWIATCTSCDVKLTLHEVPVSQLICHYCEGKTPVPESCPDCESDRVRSVGVATQQIEETIRNTFQDVPVYRVDSDAASTSNKLERLFKELHTQQRCILVGTQMLAKGHHFPNVTLVAVIGADAGFLSPDFRAPERTAQLIVQVAGRAGRAERRGEVWIQSHDPFNPNMRALVEEGYSGFVRREQQTREAASMPPVTHLAVLRAEGTNAVEQEEFLEDRLNDVKNMHVETLGPVPSPIARVSSRWRYHAALIARNRRHLHEALKTIERVSVPRSKVRWSIDVDPADMA
ncbi:MAG: primosomal protein N' [Gammaproteobacteria bacterium]|nr:primosomal protein N' [Gammaproteobacteria bacterium]